MQLVIDGQHYEVVRFVNLTKLNHFMNMWCNRGLPGGRIGCVGVIVFLVTEKNKEHLSLSKISHIGVSNNSNIKAPIVKTALLQICYTTED